MNITNATALRKNLFSSLENVIEFNEPLTVNTKNGNAIILSESDYNALIETLYISNQPGLLKKIKDGENESIKDMKIYNPKEDF